jgi:hypothetical protein
MRDFYGEVLDADWLNMPLHAQNVYQLKRFTHKGS